MSARRFERLERVKWQRREFHPVGETREEMAACMAWVRSLGHEAASLENDGFRYRSVYRSAEVSWGNLRNDEGIPCSGWQWAPPGSWLMHMAGEGQDAELDSPHDEGPIDEDGDPSWSLSHDDWQEVPTTLDAGGSA